MPSSASPKPKKDKRKKEAPAFVGSSGTQALSPPTKPTAPNEMLEVRTNALAKLIAASKGADPDKALTWLNFFMAVDRAYDYPEVVADPEDTEAVGEGD